MCGVSENESVLYEGITRDGVICVCRKCYYKYDPFLVEAKDKGSSTKVPTVRDRLMQMSGIKKEERAAPKSLKQSKEDMELNRLVETNFRKNLPKESIAHDDLVDNFHWVIMMARRKKKISKEQLAEAIAEPAIAIEYLERGILPKDYFNLVKKTEEYLQVPLFKTSKKVFGGSNLASEARFSTGLTVGDLKAMDSMISDEKSEEQPKKKKGFWSMFKRKKKEKSEEQTETEETEISEDKKE